MPYLPLFCAIQFDHHLVGLNSISGGDVDRLNDANMDIPESLVQLGDLFFHLF